MILNILSSIITSPNEIIPASRLVASSSLYLHDSSRYCIAIEHLNSRGTYRSKVPWTNFAKKWNVNSNIALAVQRASRLAMHAYEPCSSGSGVRNEFHHLMSRKELKKRGGQED